MNPLGPDSGRLRVLSLAPFPPRVQATHGGAKVLGQLLRGTADRHDVAVAYLQHETELPPDEDVLRSVELAESIARPAVGRANATHYVRAAQWRLALLAGTPRQVTELSLRPARDRIGQIVRDWHPDVVRIEYPVMAAYLPALRAAPAARILVDYDAALETAQVGGGPFERLEHRLDVRAWQRFRRNALDEVDAAAVFTELDRDRLAALAGDTEITHIPMGFELDVPEASSTGTEREALLFVGNFNHVPNLDAALHLAGEIIPRVRARHPNAVLRLVGERPPVDAVRPGVEVTGRVSDVFPYLDAAAVVVAPLRQGGGTRVKVIEALAAGKAIVAYAQALDGLELEAGTHVLVADDVDGFAAAVSSLLDDPSRRAALGRAAREWAQRNIGWQQPLDRYDELYRRAIATSRAARERS